MYRAAFISAIFAAMLTGAAHGQCTKPDAPACASAKTPFVGEKDFDECRFQMLAYKSEMEAVAACLKKDGQDERQAEAELEATLAQFNRRARGE